MNSLLRQLIEATPGSAVPEQFILLYKVIFEDGSIYTMSGADYHKIKGRRDIVEAQIMINSDLFEMTVENLTTAILAMARNAAETDPT